MPNEQKQELVKEVPEKKVIADSKKGIIDLIKTTISEKLIKKSDTNIKEDKATSGVNKTQVEGGQGEKLYKVEDLTKNLTPKKVIKLAFIFILIILIILAVYVRFIRGTPVKVTPHLINAPTPTYYLYPRYKPSIYAEDKNFKKLDEGISVLENEVKSVQIEDKTLLPPSLDFDVEF